MKYAIIAVVLALAAGRAEAYPQFQLSRDQTCSGCHISPAGGELLNENGTNTSEAISQFGTSGEFMYGKIPLPDWLTFGGDLRGAAGYLQTPERYLEGFPMQVDLYAMAHFGHFRLTATIGMYPTRYTDNINSGADGVWSREHYITYEQNPGSPEGLFVRVGRFMPVFGLRFAEHTDYTRRYGGTPLYGETYGAAIEYIKNKYEVHLTGFIKDPLIDPVVHDNGVAAYAEYRIDDQTSVGAEGMFTKSLDDEKFRGGLTAKRYFKGPDILVEGEAQVVNQRMAVGNGAPVGVVAYVLGSWFATNAILLDVGAGYYDEDVRVKDLDRECFDINLHWFTTSHFEAVLNTRVEFFTLGQGGPTGAYALLQGHYRL